MPPRWRVDGLFCHVFNRSAAKLQLFAQPHDYRRFLQILYVTRAAFTPAIRLYGYCIMPNHWHLIICPETTCALSQFMQRLTRAHALAFLSDHPERSGAIYQGRFRCVPIQGDDHLSTALLYVDRNPLKARLVSRSEDWLWSSVIGHAGIEDDALLDSLPGPIYADWLKRVNRIDPADSLADRALKRNEPLGDRDWVAGLSPEWNDRRRSVGRPRRTNREN